MIIASELKSGMALRLEGQIYKVLEVESKAGAAKLGGVVKTKLRNVASGRMWEPHFRPDERLQNVELEQHLMEFLFADGDRCTLMNSQTYEQIDLPRLLLGPADQFLQSGMVLPVEFFEGTPISVVTPDVIETRVATTAPAAHASQDSAWKEATLENGVEIRVPLFIGPGEIVRVDVRTGRYVDRVRTDRKRIA